MKGIITTIALGFIALATACVPSLNPLYSDKDLTFDPALLGVWEEKGTGESWAFAKNGKLGYSVSHTDADGRKSKLTAHLVKLEDKLFLDLFPAPGTSPLTGSSTHTFIHIVSREPMRVAVLEPRWLKDYLTDHPGAIRHQKVNGEIVLTSSPAESQKFLLAHLNTRDAYTEPSELVRKNGGR